MPGSDGQLALMCSHTGPAALSRAHLPKIGYGCQRSAPGRSHCWSSGGGLRCARPRESGRAKRGLSGLHFLPIDTAISARAVEQTGSHQDPADRMIVASAELLGAMLITRDERLRAYGGVSTAWD
jgi:hypothetical protein